MNSFFLNKSKMQIIDLPVDCLYNIFSITNDPWTFKRTYMTCQLFAQIYDERLPHARKHYTNHLKVLIELYPDKKWSRYAVSCNLNIDWNYINNTSFPWHTAGLSVNPNTTLDIIASRPDIKWNYGYLANTLSLTEEFVLKYVPHEQWPNILEAGDISFEFIAENCNPSEVPRQIMELGIHCIQ